MWNHRLSFAPSAILLLLSFTAPESHAGEIVAWGSDAYDFRLISDAPKGNDFIAVASTDFNGFALRSDGSIVGWGDDRYGQVSDLPSETGFTSIVAGSSTVFALRQDGSIVGWGANANGMLSDLPTGAGFTKIVTNGEAAFALRQDGAIVAWGGGHNSPLIQNAPQGPGYTSISIGYNTGYALRPLVADPRDPIFRDTIVEWGDYQGDPPNFLYAEFSELVSGWFASYVLLDGAIHGWGLNLSGLISDIPTGSDFLTVAAGAETTYALRSDGTIVAWGREGALKWDTPTGNGFTAIAAGGVATFALRDRPPAIPEPASWMMAVVGLTILGGASRRFHQDSRLRP